ncbi:hypothetical protein HPB50_023518 [Hyalomma asiaticum]|uniref:Uncharacterized protein n=1 Tax=Hyalomma asiaticum TaxID=266040 RepID=A0ACB7S8X2_HYAAI|nr:hypothetical protein HPB50_023518 [Hyalomma asiaticum]
MAKPLMTRRRSLFGDTETLRQDPRCLHRQSRRCSSWPTESRRSFVGRPGKRGAAAPPSPTVIVNIVVTSPKDDKPPAECADGSACGDRGSAPLREKGEFDRCSWHGNGFDRELHKGEMAREYTSFWHIESALPENVGHCEWSAPLSRTPLALVILPDLWTSLS